MQHLQSNRAGWLLVILTTSVALFFAGCAGPLAQKPVATPIQAEPVTTPIQAEAEPTATPVQSEVAPTPQPATSTAVSFSPNQTALELRPLITGLDSPVFVTHAGDQSGRIFVVEKPGTIRLFQNGQLEDTPFLDIRDRVGSSGNEQGLLGLAFAPNYIESGFFFVNYTDRSGDTVISRFQTPADSPNRADPKSEFAIIQLSQPARNHNGGMLAFGPDGYLYIGTGDGGAANDRFDNGQNPDTLLGKMLRLDVTSDLTAAYTIPPDNPWVENDWNNSPVRDEIWAFGLRNPWRFSFDRQTDDLWIADVGQNMYEEVNLTPAGTGAGSNFGWPIVEGAHCFRDPSGCDASGLVLPVLEYTHEGHCSVTGGYVYRGAQFPELNGVYFYGDYCSGAIWAATQDGTDGVNSDLVLNSGARLSSFGEDEAGELYVIDMSQGIVHQLVVVQE